MPTKRPKGNAIQWRGERISKPGIYAGVPLDDYHSQSICDGPSISSSDLRTIFNESPAHFFSRWRGNKDRIEVPTPKHFILGRAAHHIFLGESYFQSVFVRQPDEYEDEKTGEIKPWSNNAKACRAWNEARRSEGKLILNDGDLEIIRGMAMELGKHPIIRAGALNGQVERSIFFKDKVTGIWIKVRPDTIPGDSGDFVDYKTTTSTQKNDLVKTVGEFAYHQQGALIMDAANIVLDIPNPSFSLVFQEKSPPYCVRVVTLDDGDLARGRAANRRALDTFARCLKSGVWPGPGGTQRDAEIIRLSEREQQAIDDKLASAGE